MQSGRPQATWFHMAEPMLRQNDLQRKVHRRRNTPVDGRSRAQTEKNRHKACTSHTRDATVNEDLNLRKAAPYVAAC
jgi:hypothetical protein